MIKIHIPSIEEFDLEKNKNFGEINYILRDGVNSNEKTILVDTPEDADFIFLDFRHLNGRSGYHGDVTTKWIEKIVVLDYSDTTSMFKIDCPYYFKRSIVDKSKYPLKFIPYNKKIYPTSHVLKNSLLHYSKKIETDRTIDIAVFLRNSNQRVKPGFRNREIVAEFMADRFKHKNIFVGIAGDDRNNGRRDIGNEEYYSMMLNSKIVVTCNPDSYEGIERLFESFVCGPMVVVDKMITPVKNAYVNKKHLVYYESLNELEENINYYLDNEKERIEIAKSGHYHTLKYHKPSNRIDEILEIIL